MRLMLGMASWPISLAADKRITNLEKTHARDIDDRLIPQPVDLIVCDLSFISVTKASVPGTGTGTFWRQAGYIDKTAI